MTATQETVSNLTSSCKAFLSPQPALTVDEPEINSISFQDSLRFFQKQLLINSSTAPTTSVHNGNLKHEISLNCEQNDHQASESPKDIDHSDNSSETYTSSKITPIPTVDTILESVRILRAIQKSQAQRGSHWSLDTNSASDVTLSEKESLDTYYAFKMEFQKNLHKSDCMTSLPNETISEITDNDSAIESNNEGSNISSYTHLSDKTDISANIMDDVCPFWPSNNTSRDRIDNFFARAEFSSDLLEHDHSKYNKLNFSPTENTIAANTSLKASNLKKLRTRSKKINNGLDFHEGSDDTDELTEGTDELTDDCLSCSPLSFRHEQDEFKIDLTGQRPRSEECDSGIGTDKSVCGSSPTHRAEEPEKVLWSDSSSSHSESADASPFISLNGDSLAVSVHYRGIKTEYISNNKLASSNDNLVEEKINTFTSENQQNFSCDTEDNETKDECQEFNDLLNRDVSPELKSLSEENCERTECDQIVNYDIQTFDTQQDRLLESMEDQIQQIESHSNFKNFTEPEFNNIDRDSAPITEDDAKNLDEINMLEQTDVFIHNCESNYTTSPTCVNYKSSVAENSESDHEADQLSNDEEPPSVIEVSKAEIKIHQESSSRNSNDDLCTLSDTNNLENEHETMGTEKSISNSHTEETVKVSETLPQISTSSEENETNCKTESANDAVEEEERIKKNVSLLWNPVPLLQHLYKIQADTHSQKAKNRGNCISGYVDILPYGTFAEGGGHFFVAFEDGYFYCYETQENEQTIFQMLLKYADMEISHNNTIIIDNKLGRCVHFQFNSSDELEKWASFVESHCSSFYSSEFLEPVHYPLKAHRDVVIIDLGSCSTRAGILMDQPTLPTLFFPTVCATDKITQNQVYGMEALLPEVRQSSVLSFPVRPSAKITKFTMDIDGLKGLIIKIFQDLNIDPTQYKLQLSVPRSLSTNTQIALVKMLLEDIGVLAVSLTRQSLLTMYANNTSTAVVVDIGDRMDILPVVDGFILETGVNRLPYGGQRIIHHLKHALAQKHISLSNEVESFVVQYIMENLCYVAENYDKEVQMFSRNAESIKKSVPLHTFFSGENYLQNVTLDIGRFQVPEGLFNPDLWGLDFPGIHILVHKAIQLSGVDVRRKMAESIYVSGGVTLIPGFVERLQSEVAKLSLPRLKPQVHASPYRYHMAYLGACQLASSDAFAQVCTDLKSWKADNLLCLKKWHL